jgi:hypothetical protein
MLNAAFHADAQSCSAGFSMAEMSISPRASSGFTVGTVAVTALALLMGGDAARAEPALSRSQLTVLAEQAALAGASGFANSAADDDASAHAIDAAQNVIGRHDGLQAEITPSVDQMSVTVKLSARGPGRQGIGAGATVTDVSATAHYVPPDRRTHWAWASRQYFVASAQGWRQAHSPDLAGAAVTDR